MELQIQSIGILANIRVIAPCVEVFFEKAILFIFIFIVMQLNTVKSQAETRVTIQKIKSFWVLKTETCH